MKPLKHWLRKIEIIRRVDDWTNTETGENVCYAIIAAFFILWICYATAPVK